MNGPPRPDFTSMSFDGGRQSTPQRAPSAARPATAPRMGNGRTVAANEAESEMDEEETRRQLEEFAELQRQYETLSARLEMLKEQEAAQLEEEKMQSEALAHQQALVAQHKKNAAAPNQARSQGPMGGRTMDERVAEVSGVLGRIQWLGEKSDAQLAEMQNLETQLTELQAYRGELQGIEELLNGVQEDDPRALAVMKDQLARLQAQRGRILSSISSNQAQNEGSDEGDTPPENEWEDGDYDDSERPSQSGTEDGTNEMLEQKIAQLEALRDEGIATLRSLQGTLAEQRASEQRATQAPAPGAVEATLRAQTRSEPSGRRNQQRRRSQPPKPNTTLRDEGTPAYLMSVLDDLEAKFERVSEDSMRRIEAATSLEEKQAILLDVREKFDKFRAEQQATLDAVRQTAWDSESAAPSTAPSESMDRANDSVSDTPSLREMKREYRELLAANKAREELEALQEEYRTLKEEYDRENAEVAALYGEGALGELADIGDELLDVAESEDDVAFSNINTRHPAARDRPRGGQKKKNKKKEAPVVPRRAAPYVVNATESVSESDGGVGVQRRPGASGPGGGYWGYASSAPKAGAYDPTPAYSAPKSSAYDGYAAAAPKSSAYDGYAAAAPKEGTYDDGYRAEEDESDVDGLIESLDAQLAEISGVQERVAYLNRLLGKTENLIADEEDDDNRSGQNGYYYNEYEEEEEEGYAAMHRRRGVDALAGVYGDEPSVSGSEANEMDEEVARVAARRANQQAGDEDDVADELFNANIDAEDARLALQHARTLPPAERRTFLRAFVEYFRDGLVSASETEDVDPEVTAPEGRVRPPTRRPPTGSRGLEDPEMFLAATRPTSAQPVRHQGSRGRTGGSRPSGVEDAESFLRSTVPPHLRGTSAAMRAESPGLVVQGQPAPMVYGVAPEESAQSSLSFSANESDSDNDRDNEEVSPRKAAIYEEVGRLIASNEDNTEFLLRVFRELQYMTTPDTQARAIYELTRIRRQREGVVDYELSSMDEPFEVGIKRSTPPESDTELPRQKRRTNTMAPTPPSQADATEAKIRQQLQRLDQINYFIQNLMDAESPNKESSAGPPRGSQRPQTAPASRSRAQQKQQQPRTQRRAPQPSDNDAWGPQRFATNTANGNNARRAKQPSDAGVYDYAESVSSVSEVSTNMESATLSEASESSNGNLHGGAAYARNSKDDPLFDTAIDMASQMRQVRGAMPAQERDAREAASLEARRQALERRQERLEERKRALVAAREADATSASETTSVDSRQMDRLAAEYSEDIVKNEAIIMALEEKLNGLVGDLGPRGTFGASSLASMERELLRLLQQHFPGKAPDAQLSTCLSGATRKYTGMVVEVFKEDLLHDIADVLYDEMIFSRVLSQVDTSYQDEIQARMQQLSGAKSQATNESLMNEIQILKKNRMDDLGKLQKERVGRLAAAVGQPFESPRPQSDVPQSGSNYDLREMYQESEETEETSTLGGDEEDSEDDMSSSAAEGAAAVSPARGDRAHVQRVTDAHRSPSSGRSPNRRAV